MDGNKWMLWQTDLSPAPPARAEPVLGAEQRRAEPAAASAQAVVAAASTQRRWGPWEVHPCLLNCLGLGGFWAGCHPGSPALAAPASAVP